MNLQAGTMSVSELLEVIATTPRRFHLPGTNLSSYSLSASQYLEAVPSCESFYTRSNQLNSLSLSPLSLSLPPPL